MWSEMEMYNEVKNDAGDAYLYDATTDAETAREKYNKLDYNMQIVCHMEEEENAKISDLISMKVFKPTSGNVTKRLRMRQEMRGPIKISTTAEATLK